MKVLTISACVGQYDAIHDPIGDNEGVDFRMYKLGGEPLDRSLKWKPPTWGFLRTEFLINQTPSNQVARYIKTVKLSEYVTDDVLRIDYDYIVWCDANVTPSIDIPTVIEEILNHHDRFDIAFKTHPHRTTVRQEATACVQLGKIDKADAVRAKEYCTSLRYDIDAHGLYETGFFIVNARSTYAAEILTMWHEAMYETNVWRDQLFLPMCIAKAKERHQNLKIVGVDAAVLDPHLIVRKHLSNVEHFPEVKYVVPYSTQGNLGKAYNASFEGISANEWLCIMDGDILFTNNLWGRRIAKHCKDNDGCILVGSTNLLSATDQLAGARHNYSMNISEHAVIEAALGEAGASVKQLTNPPAGALFVMQRKTFDEVGPFLNGLLKIDTEYFRRALAKDVPILRMMDVYFFHYYRGGKMRDVDHLR